MGIDRGEQGGRVPSWIFKHDTVNVLFNKRAFCENIPTFTNHRSSLLRLRCREIKADWEPGFKDFWH